jgi:tripartite-type tricarboxylate transporter receptor subunit TctC
MPKILAALTTLICLAGSAEAQAPADFYKGKTITLVVGTASGDIYNTIAQVVAMYLPRYMPGSPSLLIRSMPGASSTRATEYMQNVAARDGSVIGLVQPYVILDKLFSPQFHYEPQTFNWLSRLTPLRQVGFVWSSSPVKTIAEANGAGRDGSLGPRPDDRYEVPRHRRLFG